ncbi:MAG: cytidylate kinase-like family protein [Oceanipulchritudo sp.]
MNAEQKSFRRCEAFIESNFMDSPKVRERVPVALTLSRESFSRCHEISEELIRKLDEDADSETGKWALFDQNLVRQVLEDHDLPERLARYMPEDRDHHLQGLINEILGVHPSQWQLFHYTCDTIYRLAKMGNVILIGRGSHIITRGMGHVRHARLVAPREDRVERASRRLGISTQEAAREVRQRDAASEAYARSHFDESLSETKAYDLVLNTGRLSNHEAVNLLYGLIQGP